MPVIDKRDVHAAWAHLQQALGRNTGTALHSIVVSRRRIWRAVK
jgi:hypothetical protein